MESLLSMSFDHLASFDAGKIRKGLRQLEGLLAQICLSTSRTGATAAGEKRRSLAASGTSEQTPPPKDLAQLKDDAAFREFFKLQEGFEWNVAIRLTACLERLLGKGSNGQNDLLILSTLDLLQGTLLLHPPSRTLFARDLHMNLLLDLLDPTLCPAIQSATLLALVAALVGAPANTRTFEALDGLLSVTALSKSRSASREVRMKAVEFLYFYLMPEAGRDGAAGGSLAAAGAGAGAGAGARGRDEDVRSTEEKQALLGRYLGNVQDLVEDLRETAPFGAAF